MNDTVLYDEDYFDTYMKRLAEYELQENRLAKINIILDPDPYRFIPNNERE